jgi:hypothetical protein
VRLSADRRALEEERGGIAEERAALGDDRLRTSRAAVGLALFNSRRVILQSQHGSIDDSRHGPCNQSGHPAEVSATLSGGGSAGDATASQRTPQWWSRRGVTV